MAALAQSLRAFCRSGREIYSTPQITPGFGTLLVRQEQPTRAFPAQRPRRNHGNGLRPQPLPTVSTHLQQHRLRVMGSGRRTEPPLHAIPGNKASTQSSPSMPQACSGDQRNRGSHDCRLPPGRQTQDPHQQKHGCQQPKHPKTCRQPARRLHRMTNCGRSMA